MQLRPQHTGFQVKYCGPDTDGRRIRDPAQPPVLALEGRDARRRDPGSGTRRGRPTWPISTSARCATCAAPISAHSRPCCSRTASGSRRSAGRTEAPSSATCSGDPGGFAGSALLPQRRRVHQARRRLRLRLPAGARRLPAPARRDARTEPVAAADAGDVRLVGADLRLHRGARRGAPALRSAPVAPVRGGGGQAAAGSRLPAAPHGRRQPALDARPALLPGARASPSTR